MPSLTTHEFGWYPDLADHRDYGLDHEVVVALLRKLKMRTRGQDLPASVDWREYCGPIEDQRAFPTSSAHACVALVQQMERRTSGRLLRLSRLFAHHSARRLSQAGPLGISLRTVLKSMVRCGVPPERHWPYDELHWQREPDPSLYSFEREFRTMRYVRLDRRDAHSDETLQRLKAFSAAGFPFVFGFPVCSAVGTDAEIPFPTATDGVLGGQAVVAVGYDDKIRIRSDRGAFLVRNSWGADWGDRGFGWLPYAYVSNRLAIHFWTVLKPRWLRSGEFSSPQ